MTLAPLEDSEFKGAGDAIARIAPPAAQAAEDFKFPTGAYPNQLNSITIRGSFAYVPSVGASPNGPIRFDVNTQSLLLVIDLYANQDAGSGSDQLQDPEQRHKLVKFLLSIDAATTPTYP